MNYTKSIENLKSLRNRIKQNKLKIDENSKRFGFDYQEELVKVNDLRAIPLFVSNKDDTELSIKVLPVSNDFSSEEHPTMIEYIFLKEFNDNVVFTKRSPHIVGYLGAKKANNSSIALSKFKLKKYEIDRLVKQKSLLIFSEYIKGGSLEEYSTEHDLSLYQWTMLVFQIIYTMYILQKRYSFMHNDLHFGNILIDTTKYTEEIFEYKVDNEFFYTKNCGILPKLWDFEFSQVYNKPNDMPMNFNNKLVPVINAKPPQQYDPYYDIHFFLVSLLELNIPDELAFWILELYPKEVIPEEFHKKDKPSGLDEEVVNIKNNSVSESDSESDSDSSNDSKYLTEFLWHGRILDGVGKKFDLPTVKELLSNDFFNVLKSNPSPESHSITFEY